MDWFKSYNGASIDPKYQLIAHKSKLKTHQIALLWWSFMDHASKGSERGDVSSIDFESLDFFYQFEDGTSLAAFNAFVEKGMIVDGKIFKWDERQKSEAAERQKRYRERNKKNNGDVTLRNERNGDVTLRNGDVSLLEEREEREEREEKEIKEKQQKENDEPFGSDDEKWVFENGLNYLLAYSGDGERVLKSQLEHWCKDNNPADVRKAIETAQVGARAKPINYVIKTLQGIRAEKKSGIPNAKNKNDDGYEFGKWGHIK